MALSNDIAIMRALARIQRFSYSLWKTTTRKNFGYLGRHKMCPTLARNYSDASLLEKLLPIGSVAESFGAPGTGSRKRSCCISAGQAGWQVGATHILMQESRVEAVARTYRIDGINSLRRAGETLVAALRECSLFAKLHHHQRNHCRKLAN